MFSNLKTMNVYNNILFIEYYIYLFIRMSTIVCANCQKISSIDREGYCEICYSELDKIEESHLKASTNSSLNDAEFLQHMQELNTIIPASSPLRSEEFVEETKADEDIHQSDQMDMDTADVVTSIYICEMDGCGKSSDMTTFYASANVCSSCYTRLNIDEEPKVWSFGKKIPVVHILCNQRVVKHTILFDKLKVGIYTTLQLYTSNFWTIPSNGIYSYLELSAYYNTNTFAPVVISIG
jgi:hypothetical protein